MKTMQKKGTLGVAATVSAFIFILVNMIVLGILVSEPTSARYTIAAAIIDTLLAAALAANLAYKYSKLCHQGEPICDSNLQREVLYLAGSIVDWAAVKLTQVDNLTEGIVSMKAGDFNAVKALLGERESSQSHPLTLVRRADHDKLEEKWYKATLLNDKNTATLRKNLGAVSVKDPTIFVSAYGHLYHLQPLSDFWLPQDRPASKADATAHSQTIDDVFAQAGA